MRGSPIECYGTMDLLLRNERGEKWRIMQADQSVYPHSGRARLPADAMEIGEHDYPDVVLKTAPQTPSCSTAWRYSAPAPEPHTIRSRSVEHRPDLLQ